MNLDFKYDESDKTNWNKKVDNDGSLIKKKQGLDSQLRL